MQSPNTEKDSPEEVVRQITYLRRWRLWLRLLALPGIDWLVAGILRCPRQALRWLVRTGFDYMLATYPQLTALASQNDEEPQNDDAVWAWLQKASPPPPPEVRRLFERMQGRNATAGPARTRNGEGH